MRPKLFAQFSRKRLLHFIEQVELKTEDKARAHRKVFHVSTREKFGRWMGEEEFPVLAAVSWSLEIDREEVSILVGNKIPIPYDLQKWLIT